MADSPSVRPVYARKSSRLPGGFDETDDEQTPPSPSHGNIDDLDLKDASSSLPHAQHDSSSLLPSNNHDDNDESGHDATMEESEMNHKLLDIESSSIPELSHLGPGPSGGADDTFMFAAPQDKFAIRKRPPAPIATSVEDTEHSIQPEMKLSGFRSPSTPPENYRTPAPERQEEALRSQQEPSSDMDSADTINTSSLETMSSSPTAAAAARTVSRVISMASLGGYETADERGSPESPTKRRPTRSEDEDETPRKTREQQSMLDSELSTVIRGDPAHDLSEFDGSGETTSEKPSKRPNYLQSRQSSQRLSQSSYNSGTTDTGSEATMGADFALQSGGAAPDATFRRKPTMALSRATSLGSMASGLSAWSDDEGFPSRRMFGATDLSTLNEEDRPASSHKRLDADDVPLTPKASINNLAIPTDTIIANNVRDIEVPGTFARQYRQAHGNVAPDKTPFATTPAVARGGKNMTLKEHRSTVDRLGKENFDLKMKIHFLDQALQRRSEDGIQEMITENVQLKSDKLRIEKDNHGLRKHVRELERKIKERESGETTAVEKEPEEEQRLVDAEEEVIYLREQVESYETEIRKMRDEALGKETDKRRLAEMVRSLGETRANGSSDIGSREERDMWKDMLEAETAAREQADEDNRRLRDEVDMVRAEASRLNKLGGTRSNRFSSALSQTGSIDRDRDSGGLSSAPGSTLVELDRLKHENSELQKVIGAQTSTLTSRNKEKERLYLEIEDLKLGQRRTDGRSVAGDSIFERSASRARSQSRVSNGTGHSRMSEGEREALETKNGELRDKVSELTMENQTLKNEIEDVLADMHAVDKQAQIDADTANEELHQLSVERDDALQAVVEQDEAFQDLRAQAQEEVDGLGDELDRKTEECQRLESELEHQEENLRSLQAEMRSAGEGIIRLEEDAQANLQRYNAVQEELNDSNREIEALEKSLAESSSKVQRLTVQQESSHNEIAFLREEQDGDKIKIGDLESALKTTSMSLQSEQERSREMERRLADERHQREVVGSKEKQEVQRIMNDLNRESSAARDEVRRLKKALSAREIELGSWRDRLVDFENSLREVFGDAQGTRSTFLTSISRLHKELDSATMDLEATRAALDEKETTLADRDRLLETNSHEFRKLGEALEREKQSRRADKNSFEQSLKSHQQASRSISQSNNRIAELEAARQSDRKKAAQLDVQFKEQLAERNGILLQLWKRLSTMCGPDWAHSNSLINGNLPSQEVIGNMLFWPGFSRNLLLAAKQVEGTIGIFKERIKRTERELWKEYQALEHTLEVRMKKLERVEEALGNLRAQQIQPSRHEHTSSNPDVSKLKGENRLLKAELAFLQQQQQHQQRSGHSQGAPKLDGNDIPPRGSSSRGVAGPSSPSAMMAATLMRHHSSNIVEHLASSADGASERNSMRSNSISSRGGGGRDGGLMIPAFNGGSGDGGHYNQGGQDKWIHRLRELERRLKAEREARLQDRSGARKRLEERDATIDVMKMELERERLRRETGVVTSSNATTSRDDVSEH